MLVLVPYALAVHAVLGGLDVRAPAEELFPLTTTTLKTDGRLLYVEGRAELGHTERVVSLRATTISGRGEGATLVVHDELELRAVTGGAVILQDLRIELAADFEALSMISCELRRTSLVHSVEDGSHEGKIYLGKTTFAGRTELALRMSGGAATIQGCSFDRPFRILGIPRSEKQASQVEVKVLGCNGQRVGIFGGLRIEGAKECHVAFSDLGGEEVALVECAKLELTGNNVRADRFELRQAQPGKFDDTKIKACDVRSPRIVLAAPRKEGGTEKAVFDESWFGGGTDEESIRAERIADARSEQGSGVEADLKKIRELPLGLGGGRE